MDHSAIVADFEAAYTAVSAHHQKKFTEFCARHTWAANHVQTYNATLEDTLSQIRTQRMAAQQLKGAVGRVVHRVAIRSCGGATPLPDFEVAGATRALQQSVATYTHACSMTEYNKFITQLQTTCVAINHLMEGVGIVAASAPHRLRSGDTGSFTDGRTAESATNTQQQLRARTAIAVDTVTTVAVQHLIDELCTVETWLGAQLSNNKDMAAGIERLCEAQRLHLMAVHGPKQHSEWAKDLATVYIQEGNQALRVSRDQYDAVQAPLIFLKMVRLSEGAIAAVAKLVCEVCIPMN
jgi:hypothetical protein